MRDFTTDDHAINPLIKSRLDGKFVVGTSSRFAEFKRIDRLVSAFRKFQNSRNTVLLLVGDGPEMPRLKNMVRQAGLEEKVVFTGYQTDVRIYQDAMDVCVFPSQGEPFGLVSIEALSLGKPVIVFSDGGGIAEIIGGIAEDDIVDDIDDLAGRLSDYYKAGILVESERNARKDYASHFSVEAMADNFREIYYSVFNG
jgi:glycosyltransferase involved in cell wall biosynthesis